MTDHLTDTQTWGVAKRCCSKLPEGPMKDAEREQDLAFAEEILRDYFANDQEENGLTP
ncbi:MAG: hypothetical protein KIT58_03960 [Planctomycetota bacterium]|nr:hypothetical protein [Planctomycetota bacterium]